MLLYRVLLVFSALLIVLETGMVLLSAPVTSAGSGPFVGWLIILTASAAVVLRGRSLARRGRVRSASLLLAVLVVPGLMALSSIGYVLSVLLGPRH